MAWIGDSISSLTGQISSFTKEVLTDNRDEYYDEGEQLEIAKQRLKELEPAMNFQKQEIDRLQYHCNKLEERSQTAELQLQGLSQQYRSLLEEKEKEIKVLKQKLSTSTYVDPDKFELLESSGNEDGSGPLPTSHGVADFEDVISGQRELNRLNRLVNKLSRERNYWQQVANSQPTTDASQSQPPIVAGVSSPSRLSLVTPSPSDSFCSSDASSTALITSSSSSFLLFDNNAPGRCGAPTEALSATERTSSRSSNTNTEITVDTQVAKGEYVDDDSHCNVEESRNLRRRLREAETRLRSEIEHHQHELTTLQELHEHQLSKLETQYETELNHLKHGQRNSESDSTSDLKESEDMHDVDNCPHYKKLQETQHDLYCTKRDCQRLSANLVAMEDEKRDKDTTIQRLNRKVSQLQRDRQQIGKSSLPVELTPDLNLKAGPKITTVGEGSFIVESSREIVAIEKERQQDSLDMEEEGTISMKEIDAIVSKVYPEGNEQDHQYKLAKALDGNVPLPSELEFEVRRLRTTVTTLASTCEELEKEKASLNEELEKLKHSLEEEELLMNKTDDNKELETLQLQLQSLEAEVSTLVSQRDTLENSLVELDDQHQQAIQQILTSRDVIQKKYKQLLTENETVQAELMVETEKNRELLQLQQSYDDRLKSECRNEGLDDEVFQMKRQLSSASREIETICELVLHSRVLSKEISTTETDEDLPHKLLVLKEVIQNLLCDFQQSNEECNSLQSILKNLKDVSEKDQTRLQDLEERNVALEDSRQELESLQRSLVETEETRMNVQVMALRKEVQELEDELQKTRDLAEQRTAETSAAIEELQRSKATVKDLQVALQSSRSPPHHVAESQEQEVQTLAVNDVHHVDVQTEGDIDAHFGESPGGGGTNSREAVLQEQISEMHSVITGLEEQLKEKERHLSSLRDILKVYKQNLDPDQELERQKQAELVQKYDVQIQTLESERNRMMAVLNDKARENSNLKQEVHRLMNVVSAERAALTKLQRDCNEMIRQRPDPDLEASGMTKEAMQNLARLVRDREIEIEALQQKNTTLVTLLQDSAGEFRTDGAAHEASSTASTVQALMAQREELSKQVERYQMEREQLVNALNQKHQESVGYHAEIQRLLGLLEQDNKRYEALQQEHQSVLQQFELKQKALLETQNEAVATKNKVTTLQSQLEVLSGKYDKLLIEEEEKQSEGSGQVIPEPRTVRVDREEWGAKLQEAEQLSRLVQDKDKLLYEKDCVVHEKMRSIESLKELLHRNEQELNVVKQRFDHLNGQLEGSQAELDNTREQNALMRTRMEDARAEIAILKETNSALSVTLQEREFELKALREKVGTLSLLIEQQASKANRGEEEEKSLKRLLSDSEEMRHRAQGFQAERDQALLALAHKQREYEELQEQIRAPKEQEERLLKELGRLRQHLLQVEESYTQEALQAEEREQELRKRLAIAEDRIQMATSSHSAASHHAYLQVESLQEQLKTVVEQRDDILVKLSVAEDQIAQKSAAVHTLQVVLEQLQQEKQRDVAMVQMQYVNKLEQEKQQTKKLQYDIATLEARLQEALEALEAASRLSEQLDRKEVTIRTLHEEVQFQEMALQTSKQEIERLSNKSEITVDRTIVKNLVVGFICVPRGQQKEVLKVIATVLDFNKEEREKVGLDEVKISWITSWLLPRHSPAKPVYRPMLQPTQQSLLEAFVSFLENESLPPPQVKLPIESLAAGRESPRKSAVETNKKTTTNPFAFTLQSNTDSSVTSTMAPSHLLLRPMTTALPTFSPAPVSEWSSSTNSVLREVLQKE